MQGHKGSIKGNERGKLPAIKDICSMQDMVLSNVEKHVFSSPCMPKEMHEIVCPFVKAMIKEKTYKAKDRCENHLEHTNISTHNKTCKGNRGQDRNFNEKDGLFYLS